MIMLASLELAAMDNHGNQMLEDAITLHNAGIDGDIESTKSAIELLKGIVKEEPDNGRAIAYLGSGYSLLGRDSKTVADRIRYANRGLRYLDQALSIEPMNFEFLVIRASVSVELPKIFGRKDDAINDMITLDGIYSGISNPDPLMAKGMIDIYARLSNVAPQLGDWPKKMADAKARSGEE